MGFGAGLLGGVIGAIAGGGFWGAVIGAGIGMGISSMMEKKKGQPQSREQRKQTPRPEPSPREEKRVNDDDEATPLFCCLFMCLGKLAKADGHVTPDEAQYVSGFLKSMDFSPKIRKQLIACFNEGRDSQRDFSWFASKLGEEMQGVKLSVRRETLIAFCSLAVVDEKLDPAEEQMLKQLERTLRIPGTLDAFFAEDENEKYRRNSGRSGGSRQGKTSSGQRRTSSQSPLQSSYDVLGVSPDATDAEVKKAFRKRVQEFHPDHIQGKGLSNDFIEFAKKKMQEINEAYDIISKARGM